MAGPLFTSNLTVAGLSSSDEPMIDIHVMARASAASLLDDAGGLKSGSAHRGRGGRVPAPTIGAARGDAHRRQYRDAAAQPKAAAARARLPISFDKAYR